MMTNEVLIEQQDTGVTHWGPKYIEFEIQYSQRLHKIFPFFTKETVIFMYTSA